MAKSRSNAAKLSLACPWESIRHWPWPESLTLKRDLKVVKLRGEAMQARNGSRDATTGASLPCFTNLMIFHAAVRDCSCFGMESAHTLL